METFILTFVIILISLAGLGIGIIFGRKGLRGSCGSLSCIKGADCTACKKHGKREEMV